MNSLRPLSGWGGALPRLYRTEMSNKRGLGEAAGGRGREGGGYRDGWVELRGEANSRFRETRRETFVAEEKRGVWRIESDGWANLAPICRCGRASYSWLTPPPTRLHPLAGLNNTKNIGLNVFGWDALSPTPRGPRAAATQSARLLRSLMIRLKLEINEVCEWMEAVSCLWACLPPGGHRSHRQCSCVLFFPLWPMKVWKCDGAAR